MGQTVSCKRSSEVCPRGVRIVHMTGLVEEFPAAVKVKQVLQNHPRHFMCCSRDFYAINTNRPLPAEEELRLGELYFLLPIKALDSDLSPKNLAALAARLLSAAKKEASKRAHRRAGDGDSKTLYSSSGNYSMYDKLMGSCENTELQTAYKEHLVVKSKSWRPSLNTIQETCFARQAIIS